MRENKDLEELWAFLRGHSGVWAPWCSVTARGSREVGMPQRNVALGVLKIGQNRILFCGTDLNPEQVARRWTVSRVS